MLSTAIISFLYFMAKAIRSKQYSMALIYAVGAAIGVVVFQLFAGFLLNYVLQNLGIDTASFRDIMMVLLLAMGIYLADRLFDDLKWREKKLPE